MGRGKRPATYEDIEALPPGWVGEIIDDELWALPRPARWHAWVASVLAAKLGSTLGVGQGGPGGWWILIGLVPLIGTIVLLVFWVLPGTQGDNGYGPDPHGDVVERFA